MFDFSSAIDVQGFLALAADIHFQTVALSVFALVSLFFMGEKFRLDFIWAALCLCGAVFFIFRK